MNKVLLCPERVRQLPVEEAVVGACNGDSLKSVRRARTVWPDVPYGEATRPGTNV